LRQRLCPLSSVEAGVPVAFLAAQSGRKLQGKCGEREAAPEYVGKFVSSLLGKRISGQQPCLFDLHQSHQRRDAL